jgi:hypothetical protein
VTDHIEIASSSAYRISVAIAAWIPIALEEPTTSGLFGFSR